MKQVTLWDSVNTALAVTKLWAQRITWEQIAGAGFGIAGYDWPAELEVHQRAIDALPLSAPYGLVNDAMVGLIAGTSEGWGIGVVSGTGSNCWGRDRQGHEGRVTGCGAWTMRGPRTRLTEAFMALVGATSELDLLEGLYLGRYTFSAKAAPVVFRVAAEGDAVAQGIIHWAGQELASLAAGVIRQLGFEALDFEVVQIGSVFNGSPVLGQTMMQKIHEIAPGARAVRLTVPPVVGGVLLGMEQAGIDYPTVRDTLIESTARLLPA